MLKHFLNPPNWFTGASLFCSFYAILCATGAAGEASYYKAGLMIIFAGVFDMLDGRVARMTGRSSEFGVQLDSLADIVSFGIAPAVLVYCWALQGMGWLGMAVAFSFLLCGAMRLARFNTEADGTKASHSKGLTITAAGGTLCSLVMVHGAIGNEVVAHPANVIVFTLILSWLQVSEIPYPSASGMSRRAKAMIAITLGVGICMALLYRDIAYWFFVFGIVHVLWGPILLMVQWKTGRRVEDTTLVHVLPDALLDLDGEEEGFEEPT